MSKNGPCDSAGIDESALAEYYRDNWSELCRRTFSLTGDREAAEDIVQQAFTRTVAAVRQGGQVADLSRWLHRVIRNLVADHYRDMNARPTDQLWEDACIDTHPEPPVFVEMRERCDAIFGALDKLSERQREAVLLTAVHGLDQEETASVLGTSAASIKQCIYRARKAIRASIGSSRETLGAMLVWLFPFKSKPDDPSRLTRIRNDVGVRLSGERTPADSPSTWDRTINAVVQPATSLVATALVLAPIAAFSGPAEAGDVSGNTTKHDAGKSLVAESATAAQSPDDRASDRSVNSSPRRNASPRQNAVDGQHQGDTSSQTALPNTGGRRYLQPEPQSKRRGQHKLNEGESPQGTSKTVHGQGDEVQQDPPGGPSQPESSVSASPSEQSGQDEKTIEEPSSSGGSTGPANADPSGSEPDDPDSGSLDPAPGSNGT